MKVHSISLIVLATTTQSKIGIYFLVHKHNIFLLHNHLTMFLITSDESAKTLSGKTILFFHRDKGCSNCDKMRPIAKDFVADGITVYSIEADSNRDLASKMDTLIEKVDSNFVTKEEFESYKQAQMWQKILIAVASMAIGSLESLAVS